MAFQHPTALGRIWALGTTVSGHRGALEDAAAGTANAMAATTATRAAVAGRLPRTIAVGAPGRRHLSGRRDTPLVADDLTFRAAAPVRSAKANIRSIVMAPRAPQR